MALQSTSSQALAALAITQVQDSTISLKNPDTTVDTQLALSGTGAESAVVLIYDKEELKGSASVKSDGTWAFTVSTLTTGEHRFTARTTAGIASAPWVITRVVIQKPVITRVVDSKGTPIPKNSSTLDPNVTLSGTASVNSTVEILDNASVSPPIQAPAGVWTLEFTHLEEGLHNMVAKSGGLSSDAWPFTLVKAPVFNLIRPTVPKATGDGTHFNFDTAMYEDSYLSVMVNYTGMATGQTIQLQWSGWVAWHSEIKTVGAVGSIEFRVPRIEVVDAIGRTVPITYTVRLADGTSVGTSAVLALVIAPQAFDLVPPTISANNLIVTVTYPGMNTPHTARVRWQGVKTHDTGEQNLDTRAEEFEIHASWISENKGREVLINYTVYRNDGHHFLFSRVLRKRM